jgi:hypothetical protein
LIKEHKVPSPFGRGLGHSNFILPTPASITDADNERTQNIESIRKEIAHATTQAAIAELEAGQGQRFDSIETWLAELSVNMK